METNEQKTMNFSVVAGNVDIPSNESNQRGTNNSYAWWGEDNKYPQFIKSIYKGSTTVKAIINGTVNFILGNDITVNESAIKFKDYVNGKCETFYDLIGFIATDYLTYNAFAIEVIYNQLGTVSELYALDVTRCRTNQAGTKVYYSKKSWGQYSAKYDEYDAFNPIVKDVTKPQIYFYKGFCKETYPAPFWEGSLRDALAEIQCSKYVLNSMSNGLAAKTIITIPDEGNLTQEDYDQTEKLIKDKFCGPDAQSSFFLFWQRGDKQIKVDPINVEDESDKFNAIKSSARENIFISFQATPNLFGLPSATTGFNSQEYQGAYKLYEKAKIVPTQKEIVRILDKILGTKNCITIEPYIIDFGD